MIQKRISLRESKEKCSRRRALWRSLLRSYEFSAYAFFFFLFSHVILLLRVCLSLSGRFSSRSSLAVQLRRYLLFYDALRHQPEPGSRVPLSFVVKKKIPLIPLLSGDQEARSRNRRVQVDGSGRVLIAPFFLLVSFFFLMNLLFFVFFSVLWSAGGPVFTLPFALKPTVLLN